MEWYPDLLGGKILDLGSGTGKFLTQIAEVGGDAIGIEPSQRHIDASRELARSLNVSVEVQKGKGESLPFSDETFGFVNMAEIIEHVDNPERVLGEVFRVLKTGGGAYMSVPNRLGLYDPHYHTYAVNWLPRSMAPLFLKLSGKEKQYAHESDDIGAQRLEAMHYYTFSGIQHLCRQIGFTVIDIRDHKIRSMDLSNIRCAIYVAAYKIARIFYFNTFHVGLVK